MVTLRESKQGRLLADQINATPSGGAAGDVVNTSTSTSHGVAGMNVSTNEDDEEEQTDYPVIGPDSDVSTWLHSDIRAWLEACGLPELVGEYCYFASR
jgi:hypothetical protein